MELLKGPVCPICGSSPCGELPFFSQQREQQLRIASCAVCTHRFVTDPPNAEALAGLYEDYYSKDSRTKGRVVPSYRDRVLVDDLVRRLPPNASILEIGCNFGETLRAFPQSYDLWGVELSVTAAKVAAAHPGLNIRQGFFEAVDFGSRTFDCILALAVIEHVREPKQFLAAIRGLLHGSGVLVLMTGDHGSKFAREVGAAWSLYHDVGHLHFFSKESLEMALSESGFMPTRWRWAGQSAATSRIPKSIRRLIYSQASSLFFTAVGSHRRGPNMYSWSKPSARSGKSALAEPPSESANIEAP